MILSGSQKLKQYPERIYVGPDEPLDVRRKNIFERIQKRAIRDGKRVVAENDTLIIDGVTVFSLSTGYVNLPL